MKKWMICLLAGLLGAAAAGCAQETLAQEPIAAEEDAEVLKIGISPDYAPFAFVSEGENGDRIYKGADIALGNYIAEQLQIEPEFVEMEFEACLDAVEEGSVDLVLLGMIPTEERKMKMDVTDAYYQPGKQVLVVKKEQAAEYTVPDAFAGKTVAARYGTLQAQLVTEQMPESYMELTETIGQSVILLRSGLVDAVALDEQDAIDVIRDYPELIWADAGLEYEGQPIAGGVKKGETELLQSVNTVLENVREEKLYLKWLDQAYQDAAKEQR